MVKNPVGIIGAGLVGLATARQLALSGVAVVVWEKEATVARHQSGHNSGVVHAGIYYQPGSAKAENCRRGVKLLRAYCADRSYLPWLEPSHVVPAPAGVRAQAVDPRGALVDDFIIHRIGPVTAVRNAASPAATASIAIAEQIVIEL